MDIKITSVPAKVNVNFEELKQAITDHLEKYQNVVITSETVQDGKKLIEQINTTRKQLEKRRKDEVAKASEPVKLFDNQMKELVKLHDQVLGEIRAQVARFEEQRKAEILEDLKALRERLWNESCVDAEFRHARCEDLALLGAVTAKGNFTSKTMNEVTHRVGQDKALQSQTELRLARLEADSYKAGLAAPLNRGHVEHFLFAPDEEYQAKLEALFKSEIAREEQAVQRRRAEFNNERKMVDTALAEAQPAAQPVPPMEEVRHEAPAGQIPLTVTCTFHITVGPKATNEAVRTKIREKLEAAGFTTLANIDVYRNQEAA